jgi:hypothetical protein
MHPIPTYVMYTKEKVGVGDSPIILNSSFETQQQTQLDNPLAP